jgi:hypothetical protein
MGSRRLRTAALCLVLVFFTVPSFGSSIIINGDPPTTFTPVTRRSFTFGSNASGGGDTGFTNESGETWTRLDVLFTLPILKDIMCQSPVFVTCTMTTSPPTTTGGLVSYDLMFGPAPQGGIFNGENFEVNLNDNGFENTDPNGAGSWTPGEQFTAVANAPEPGSFLLGCLGFLLVGFYSLRAAGLVPKRFSKAAN